MGAQSKFMNGVPELLILRVLHDQEMYGYQIVQHIREVSDSVFSLGEGVLYPTLHALERRGCLRTRRATVDGRKRVYYSVTRKGRRQLNDTLSEWVLVTKAVKRIIGKAATAYGS